MPMPLPEFRSDGWLPEGHHPATWDDIITTFGGEPQSKRRQVLAHLLEWRDQAQASKLSGYLVLNGSFISQKAEPGDFDCLFVYDEATEERLKTDEQAQSLIRYHYCKARFAGDIFAFAESTVQKYPLMCRLDSFDYDKTAKQPKGVVEVKV
jgi:hypothetical protein